MKHILPDLPYKKNALAPYISEETIDFHYGKHHQNYVNALNALIENTEFANASLENIIKSASGPIFNNAAQVWNHTFFWDCLNTPQKAHPPTPQGALGKAIDTKWGSYTAFQEAFTKQAINTFGSGWTWLIRRNNGDLDLLSTSNAGTPLTTSDKALLTLDVWEHAYYLDYQNARPKFIEAFWNIVNWNFAAENFK